MNDYIVCLPTRNEVESVGIMIDAIKKLNVPLFIVDSHSNDGTLNIATQKGVEVFQRDEYGSGYGCGVRKAIDVAYEKGYERLVILDCDTTYPPEIIPEIAKHLADHDHVIGYRDFTDIEFWHRLANIIHTTAVNLLYNSHIKDINSGMRGLKVSKFYKKLTAVHMEMVAQMTCVALRNNMKIKQVPIKYGARRGESKIGIIDGWHILWEIIKQRFK